MQQIPPVAIALGLTVACAAHGHAQWSVSSSRDEMTDAVVQTATQRGTAIGTALGPRRPALVVRCRGDELDVYALFGFVVDSDAGVRVRWDAEPVSSEPMIRSDSWQGLFAVHPVEWIPRMQAGSTLRIELTEALHGRHVARFDLNGFSAVARQMPCIRTTLAKRDTERAETAAAVMERQQRAQADSAKRVALLDMLRRAVPAQVPVGARVSVPAHVQIGPDGPVLRVQYSTVSTHILGVERDTVLVARSVGELGVSATVEGNVTESVRVRVAVIPPPRDSVSQATPSRRR